MEFAGEIELFKFAICLWAFSPVIQRWRMKSFAYKNLATRRFSAFRVKKT
jgi:hypothetical protein